MADVKKAKELKASIEKIGGNLIVVSKKFPAKDIVDVYKAGVVNFGENYISEAAEKIDALKDLDIKWHFIGRVQSGNLNKIVNRFYMIHSVYKLEHIEKIDARSHKKQKILLQLQHKKDKRGFGLDETEIRELLKSVNRFEKIDFSGLMFMPPADFKGAELQGSFEWAKSVFESLKPYMVGSGASWDSLSMGMSADYETALAAGSTHVRLGTLIFGQRP